MNVREKLEAWEHEYLCEYAAFSGSAEKFAGISNVCSIPGTGKILS